MCIALALSSTLDVISNFYFYLSIFFLIFWFALSNMCMLSSNPHVFFSLGFHLTWPNCLVRGSEEELLTISQDGFVMLYTITNSILLIGSRQMQIFLHEGETIQIPANRWTFYCLKFNSTCIDFLIIWNGSTNWIVHLICFFSFDWVVVNLDMRRYLQSKCIQLNQHCIILEQLKVSFMNAPSTIHISIKISNKYISMAFIRWNFHHGARRYS